MTNGLIRYYGTTHLHFITCSCYHRTPQLGTPERRDLLLEVLEHTRLRYRFVVHGYVLMPEHFHLLITEPDIADPSIVMKVVKQRFSRTLTQSTTDPIWQKRFYDFNVWSNRKQVEKLRYMHRNPVKRGLVTNPQDWKWSSFRWYASREQSQLRVMSQEWDLQVRGRDQSQDLTTSHSFQPQE